MPKYIVQGADLHHDGKHFAEGATLNAGKAIDIDDDHAEVLIAKGRLVVVNEETMAKESPPKKK